MGWLVFVVVVLCAAIGSPLFVVMGGGAMGLFTVENEDLTSVLMALFSEKFAESPTLMTIPLFTLAGYIMAESKTPQRLVRVSRALLGWLPGGLAIVVCAASAFFTTFSGASGITIVAIGGLLFPALIKERYSEKFSLGIVTTGGSLGLLFPPSLPIILYGVVAGVSIDELFLAGMLPGIVSVLILWAYSVYIGVREQVPRTKFRIDEAFASLWEAKWEVLLPVVLLGGMYLGLLRIHEAAAFTAIYVLVIEVFIYKDLSLTRDIPKVIRESMTLVGAILIILACALGLTEYLVLEEVPMKILGAMESLLTSKIMFLLVLNVFLIIVGCLMDIFSAIIVVVPLIIPIANHFNVHPLHLGTIFLLNLEIGYLTPPVGINLFISSFRFRKPVVLLYRSVINFILLLIIALLLTTYVPSLSLTLPRIMRELTGQGEAPPEPEQPPDIAPDTGEPPAEPLEPGKAPPDDGIAPDPGELQAPPLVPDDDGIAPDPGEARDAPLLPDEGVAPDPGEPNEPPLLPGPSKSVPR